MTTRTIELTGATQSLAYYAQQVDGGSIVVTRDGRPLAAVVALPNTDAETIALSQSPQFLAIMERSEEMMIEDEDMLPECDFTGGVRGRHYEVMRKGYTVKINQADGTTRIQHFKAALWDRQIEAHLEAGRLGVLLAEAEKEHAAGLSQPL